MLLANDVKHHYIEDHDGNRMTQAMYQGRYYPAFPGVIERLERLPELRARGDDIVICAYPKSGNSLCLFLSENYAYLINLDQRSRMIFVRFCLKTCMTVTRYVERL